MNIKFIISENVLDKYLTDKEIILAVVNKFDMCVEEIYSISPEDAVYKLREKLRNKIDNLNRKGETIRRLQVSLSFSDIKNMNSFRIIYKK